MNGQENIGPQIPSEEGKSESLDVRTKAGKGLDFWAKEMTRHGVVTEGVATEFIDRNNSKEEQIEKLHLPQLKHYGFFSSIEEIREKLASRENERFIIRCSSKETGEIKRLLDTDLDGACAFAEKLPGGFDAWNVEMKEFVETMMAGTIIVDTSGRTTIEMWHGAHLNHMKEGWPLYSGSFDPEKPDMSFKWAAPQGATDLPDLQGYAIKALKKIFPHVRPRPNEPIYIEYGVKPNGEIYFIEANESSFLTQRPKGRVRSPDETI